MYNYSEVIDLVTTRFPKLKQIYELDADYYEDLLLNGDDELKNLVGVAVIESLFFEKAFLVFYDDISSFFGKLTIKSFEDCMK